MRILQSDFFKKHQTTILLIWLIFLSLTFNASIYILNPTLDPSGSQFSSPQLDLQFSYLPTKGMEVVNNWRGDGRANYLNLIWIDVLFALSYGPFFFLLIRRLGGKHVIANIALSEMLTNWTETGLEIIWMIYHSPDRPMTAIFLIHSIVATVKWALVPVYIGYSVWLVLRALWVWCGSLRQGGPLKVARRFGEVVRFVVVVFLLAAIKFAFVSIHGQNQPLPAPPAATATPIL